MWPEQKLNEAFLLRGNGLTWLTFGAWSRRRLVDLLFYVRSICIL